ncbi:Receptor-like serine/threonine-protein kinase ALE2 [Glycine max]|nr:Receptor-like serine/threonine-protein kinase ALE2 [Glycine max]
MAISSTWYLFLPIILSLCLITLCGTVLEDLKNLHQPPDFNTTIFSKCLKNPSLRYCSSNPMMDLEKILGFTIVASYLCNEPKNPNCVESFPKVDLRNRPNIAPLYLSFDFFWKYFPLSIISIDLSNNSMKGDFPIDVLHCTQIQSLDLSINAFSGDIPIQSFSPLINLTFLNRSYNCFSESKLSDSQFSKRFNSSSFLHSGALLDQKRFTVKAVFLLVGFPILVILMAAIDGFSNKYLVGKSDVVHIYKGILRDGTEVKIEMYWDDIPRDSYRKFVEEFNVLSKLHHKNLFRVLGWCRSRKFRSIITEWTREENVEIVKVLMRVVECMRYLQDEWPEVDYELNTSSILLSDKMEPLISRFKVGDQNSNRRKVQEQFDGGDAGFIRYLRTLNPADLQQKIDERMEVTETNFHQVKQALSIGLMCIDQSNSEKPSLGMIFNTIARGYKASLVSANHRISHGEKFKGHMHVQT